MQVGLRVGRMGRRGNVRGEGRMFTVWTCLQLGVFG